MELIKIIENNGKSLVSGRELYRFLEVKSKYADWIKNRIIKYEFIENEDYIAVSKILETAQGNKSEYLEHGLTLEMAKEISMVENNEKGKEARQYFIKCEKNLKQLCKDSYMIQDPLERAKVWIREQEEMKILKLENEKNVSKVVFADAVAASKSSILVGELAKILKQNNVDIGQNKLFIWLRKNGYLIKRNGTDYNMPTQRAMEQGLFEIKETSVTHGDGHISISKTPKVTGKGQQYFINKFLGR